MANDWVPETTHRSPLVKILNFLDFCDNIDQCDENIAEKLEKYNEELTHLFPIKQRFKRIYSYINLEIWIFIAIVATLAAWIGISLSFSIGRVSGSKNNPENHLTRLVILKSVHSIENYYLRYAAYSGSMIACGLISVFICQVLSPQAVGSGVPQVKTVLSGVRLFNFLEKKVLVAKILAMFFSGISNVGTGKEGPMIHCSTMLSYNLSSFGFFKRIKNVRLTFLVKFFEFFEFLIFLKIDFFGIFWVYLDAWELDVAF